MNTKRRLSPIIIALVLVMILSVVPMFTFGASAEDGDFTVKFAVPDGLTAPGAQSGSSITLPAVPALDGYTVVGWTEEKVPDEAETAPKYYAAGSTFTPTANTKLYALYSKTTTGEIVYEKYSGTITEGDYIIVGDKNAAKSSVSSKRLENQAVTISNNIVTNPTPDIIWTFKPNGSDWTIYNAKVSQYLGGSGTKNAVGLYASVTDNTKMTITGSSTYVIVSNYNQAKGVNHTLRNNGTYGFAFYAATTGSGITLYKATGGSTTVYTTTNVSELNTVNFSAPAGITFDAISQTSGSQITLPTVSLPEGYEAYTFAGWTDTNLAENTTTAPELYNGTYTITEDTTLYAVFTTRTTTTGWALVTSASNLAIGDEIVILAKDTTDALSTNQKTNNRGVATVTKLDSGIITFGDDVQILTLKAGTSNGTFGLYTGSGYLYAASDAKNYLKTQENNDVNGSFTITIASDGTASIVATGSSNRNVMQYNYNGGSPLFACYSGANYTALNIYKNSDISTIVYTTAPAAHVCTPGETKIENKVDATCTADGSYEEVIYCECGEELSRTPVAVKATGHNNVNGECSECNAVLDPKISGANLTIGADLSVNYYVALPEAYEFDEIKMVFTFNEKTIEVVDFVIADDGRYVFTFTGIAPQCMTDNIAAELVIDGETVAEKAEYSVYTYAKNKLADEITDEFRTLIFDMLNYGAKAQLYRGYHTDALATDGIEGFVASEYEIKSGDKSATVPTRDDVKFIAAGVNFDYVNRIYVKFTVAEGVDFEIEADCKLEVIKLDATTYIAYSDAIYATEFNRIVTFDLYADDEFVQEVEYTVSAYVYSQLGYNDAMADLAIALYNYGASADAYAKSIK